MSVGVVGVLTLCLYVGGCTVATVECRPCVSMSVGVVCVLTLCQYVGGCCLCADPVSLCRWVLSVC